MRTITASKARQGFAELLESVDQGPVVKIGRASCRERVCDLV